VVDEVPGVVCDEVLGVVVDDVLGIVPDAVPPEVVPEEVPGVLPDDGLGELLEESLGELLDGSFDDASAFSSCSCCASHSANFGWFWRKVSFCAGVICRHLAFHSPVPGPVGEVLVWAHVETEPKRTMLVIMLILVRVFIILVAEFY